MLGHKSFNMCVYDKNVHTINKAASNILQSTDHKQIADIGTGSL